MSERAERQPFKLHFGPALVDDLAERIRAVYPVFPVNAFRAEVAPRLDPLELKGRVATIAAGLRQQLPSDYPTALGILLQILGPPLRESEGMFVDSWYLMPVATFVEQYGLDHPAASLAAMHAITQRHTAEFAIRPFLLRHPEATLAALRDWVHDESFHVRRLVSEGTRGRLPWGANLPAFIADPTPVLALLEALRDDPSAYVRRSVANNLNGIARDHPELLIRTLRRWRENASPERLRLIQHALRTLVKAGHPEALALLGAAAPQIELLAFSVAPERLRIGEAVTISARIVSRSEGPQRLVVDYALHMPGATSRARSKVFKLRTETVGPGQTLTLARRHALVPVSVRKLYPGPHRVVLQVNGETLAEGAFELLA